MWEFALPGGLVLARPDSNGFFLLNSSARFLWSCLQRGLSPAEAIPVFAAHFGIPQELAATDVHATIDSWSSGLLATARRGEAPPPPPAPSEAYPPGLCRLDCLVHGRPLRILLEPGLVHDEIAPRLSPVLSSDPAPPLHTFAVHSTSDRVLVLRDRLLIGDEPNAAAARAILLQALAYPVEPAAILHAGACAGVLIAGQTHSGKTTLCAALMARGLPYHCDDSAVLSAGEAASGFRVASMPFSIMLRQGSWPILDPLIPALRSIPHCVRWGESVRFLPPLQLSGPAAVRALVFANYDPALTLQTARLSVFETLVQLQRSGFWVAHSRESIQRFLDWLATIPRYRLDYSCLPDAMAFIEHLSRN